MDLTIIIVNWNGGELLRDCLASIAAHREGLDAQVIVVDNNSSDGSREMAEREFPQFTVINSGSNLGFGKANNLPRPRVKSDLVLFLNPDTVLLKNSLVSMVQHLRAHEEIGALGCKMCSPNGEVHELGLQYFLSPWTEFANLTFVSKQTRRWLSKRPPLQDPQQSGYVTKLYGGCLLCRKEVLDAVGWFDERYFMYAEDVDLCRTILDRGWKLYYLSTAEIIHLAGGASKKAPSGFALLMKQESTVKFMRKYHGPTGALLYRLAAVVGSTFRLTALAVLRVLALVSSKARQRDFPAAFSKQRTLFLWSLGLRKPMVAGQSRVVS